MTFPVSFHSFLKVCFPDVSEAIPVLFQIPLKLIFLHSSFLFSVRGFTSKVTLYMQHMTRSSSLILVYSVCLFTGKFNLHILRIFPFFSLYMYAYMLHACLVLL